LGHLVLQPIQQPLVPGKLLVQLPGRVGRRTGGELVPVGGLDRHEQGLGDEPIDIGHLPSDPAAAAFFAEAMAAIGVRLPAARVHPPLAPVGWPAAAATEDQPGQQVPRSAATKVGLAGGVAQNLGQLLPLLDRDNRLPLAS
jgi:hypothetical protein